MTRPGDGPLVTVAEFAAKHCTDAHTLTVGAVQDHVNRIMMAAVARNRVIWRVGIDVEGRVSLIWESLPEFVWAGLLREGQELAAVVASLGGLFE